MFLLLGSEESLANQAGQCKQILRAVIRRLALPPMARSTMNSCAGCGLGKTKLRNVLL